jgi:hypothetical protein
MKLKTQILFGLFAATLFANEITDTRTPTRRGGGGDGKCTIEVEVDGVAEVEIFGNRAQIRTLAGAPARFRRFECNQDIPDNPNDFRFQGIDGRGRQELVRNPGRGPAVVRIEDPKGGSQGYTFDIFWRGAAGPWNNSNGNGGGGIFGPGNGGGGNWNNNPGGWGRDLRYQGRGSGNFRSDRGASGQLGNCRVNISRRGEVEVFFETEYVFSISLTGRVTRTDGDRVYADMRGVNLNGEMEIETDGRNRVRRVYLNSGSGRDRFELNWRD